MKLKRSRFALKDRVGETRVVTKFLWWPKSLNTGKWRWMECVNIIEEIHAVDIGGSCEWGKYEYKWCELGFDDENNQQTVR